MCALRERQRVSLQEWVCARDESKAAALMVRKAQCFHIEAHILQKVQVWV